MTVRDSFNDPECRRQLVSLMAKCDQSKKATCEELLDMDITELMMLFMLFAGLMQQGNISGEYAMIGLSLMLQSALSDVLAAEVVE